MVVAFVISQLPLVTSSAQTLREAFAAMPDGIMPTLTKNNRLDMIDFMDARMKAAVTNRLGGESVMTHLGSDSLAVKVSDALTVEMKMETADTTAVISVKRVYTTLTGERQCVLTRYAAPSWEELMPAAVVESSLQRKMEKLKD